MLVEDGVAVRVGYKLMEIRKQESLKKLKNNIIMSYVPRLKAEYKRKSSQGSYRRI